MKSSAIFATSLLMSSCTKTTTMTMAFTARAPTTSSSSSMHGMKSSPLHATLTADELSSMSKSEQLKILGVEEEKLALGIDPDEVLQFIGTREDLMNRIQTDIPKFSPAETSLEVDKFLMDGEMLDTFIKYNQRKAEDPDWEPEYAEQDNSPVTAVVNFVSQYGIFVVGGILIKDIVTNFMDKNGGGGEGAEVLVSSALDGVHHLSNILV